MTKERYSRNILVEKIGESGQKKLFESKILVAGAGGLGSTVLANLASLGVGKIGVVDNDILELSNLNRQYIHKFKNLKMPKVASAKEWIEDFNPEINVQTYQIQLDENNYKEIIEGYDLIIDCFDSYKSKFLLNEIAIKSKKTLIHGGVTEFFGQVTTIVPDETACLACIFPDYDVNSYIARGVISPSVTTIASIQSLEAVKILLGFGETLKNRILVFDGLKMKFKKLKISKNPNCKIC